jgi:hypothetical protein
VSARDSYVTSVKAAAVTKTATLTADELTKQETINQSGVNVGYTLQAGNNVNFIAAIKAAAQDQARTIKLNGRGCPKRQFGEI